MGIKKWAEITFRKFRGPGKLCLAGQQSEAKNNDSYEFKDHQLFGAKSGLWQKLRDENNIASNRKRMARKITLVILSLAPFRALQRLVLKFKIRNSKLNGGAPVFVIGHWRSGTTHLHYLLSQDPKFSHLTAYQALFFNIAFTTKWFFKSILKRVMPKTRPQDNVKIDPDAPTEDEHAFVNITRMSGMHLFFFPKNKAYFDKYNCFDGIGRKELKEWKRLYANMLKQIEQFNGTNKKLLLKNPHSTARIKVLLDLYPNAKFIYIHRNPYEVFNSTRILYKKAVRSQFLQELNNDELNDLILYCYEKMLKGYIKERQHIPKDQLIEVSYSELTDAPLDTIKKVYARLNLGDNERVNDRLKAYLNKLGKYKQNPVKEIPRELKEKITSRWGFAFDEWNYSKQ